MANFFGTKYGTALSGAAGAIPGGWGDLFSTASGYLTAKDQAKAAAKLQAQEAQREFELAKMRVQAEASRSTTMPGIPAQVQGGTGLAPAIPTWALLGAGLALVVVVLAMRK
jgi:hypothetical protein